MTVRSHYNAHAHTYKVFDSADNAPVQAAAAVFHPNVDAARNFSARYVVSDSSATVEGGRYYGGDLPSETDWELMRHYDMWTRARKGCQVAACVVILYRVVYAETFRRISDYYDMLLYNNRYVSRRCFWVFDSHRIMVYLFLTTSAMGWFTSCLIFNGRQVKI